MKNPAKFLGAKVLTPMEQDKVLGGMMMHQQQQQQQQLQQQAAEPMGTGCTCNNPCRCRCGNQ